jgi:hypothetical protein
VLPTLKKKELWYNRDSVTDILQLCYSDSEYYSSIKKTFATYAAKGELLVLVHGVKTFITIEVLTPVTIT